MATTAGFKQQCPSCEAMVPIKDHSLIGRKIDCPKCKYRFVVEEPTASDDEPPVKKGKTGPAAKRPGSAKPIPKKEGSSTLTIGIMLAVVAVVALGIGGFIFFQNSKDKDTKGSGPSGGTTAGGTTDTKSTSSFTAAPFVSEAPQDLTELLPNDTVTVFSSQKPSALANETGPLGQAVFFTLGAFHPEVFEARLGLRLDTVSRLLRAEGRTGNQDWVFNVVRTSKPFNPDALLKALGIDLDRDAVRTPQQSKTYYTARCNELMEGLSSLVRGRIVPPARAADGTTAPSTIGVYLYDDYMTVVLADKAPLERLLEEGKPKTLYEAPVPTGSEQPQIPPGGIVPGGKGDFPAGGGDLPAPSIGPDLRIPGTGRQGQAPGRSSSDARGADRSQQATFFRQDARGSASGVSKTGARGRQQDPTMPDQPVPGQGDVPNVQAVKDRPPTYLTLQPSLKALLDLVEANDPAGAIVSAATLRPDRDLFGRVERASTLDLGVILPNDKEHLAGLQRSAIALQKLDNRHVTVIAALAYESGSQAATMQKFLQEKQKPIVVKRILRDLGIEVKDPPKPTETTPQAPGAGGPFGGGGGALGGSFGGASLGTGQIGAPGLGGQFQPPPGAQDPAQQAEQPTSHVFASVQGETVKFTIDLTIESELAKLTTLMQAAAIHAKGLVDMATGRQGLFDLADAVFGYVGEREKNGKPADRVFPRGALVRDTGSDNLGFPWPPQERVSWMVELLPYLPGSDYEPFRGEEGRKLFDTLKRKGWYEGDGLLLAQMLVPAFVVNAPGAEKSWWVSNPGQLVPLGATHFVGVGGVGLDVVDEPASTDPARAKRFGILGNERQTNFDDVKGGLNKTILLLQVPLAASSTQQNVVLRWSPDGTWQIAAQPAKAAAPAAAKDAPARQVFKTPWLIGGSPIRGVPETNSIDPFVCIEYKGKLGTLAIMADGTVRFLGKDDMTDKVFQGLCTVQGDKPEDEEFERIAPKIYSPKVGRSELKTQVPTAALEPQEKPTAPVTPDAARDEKPAAEQKPPAEQSTAPK